MKIINYHEIEGENKLNGFENIIKYLKINYKIISVDEIYNNIVNDKLEKKSFGITFDDGHKSFYNNIFPIIKKYKVPITLFVSPKICINKENFWQLEIRDYDSILLKKIISDITKISLSEFKTFRVKSILKSLKLHDINEVISRYQKITNVKKKSFQYMTVDQLSEVEKSGLVTIGAHTMNHPILLNENDDVCKYEIEESINQLSSILNHEIKYFSYPFGVPKIDYSEREMKFTDSKGIKLSFSTDFKKVKKENNLMEIPRGEVSIGKRFYKTKISLWEYWKALIYIKNNEHTNLIDRVKNIDLFESYYKTVNSHSCNLSNFDLNN